MGAREQQKFQLETDTALDDLDMWFPDDERKPQGVKLQKCAPFTVHEVLRAPGAREHRLHRQSCVKAVVKTYHKLLKPPQAAPEAVAPKQISGKSDDLARCVLHEVASLKLRLPRSEAEEPHTFLDAVDPATAEQVNHIVEPMVRKVPKEAIQKQCPLICKLANLAAESDTTLTRSRKLQQRLQRAQAGIKRTQSNSLLIQKQPPTTSIRPRRLATLW